MATIDITEQSFTETLKNNEIVFVDFWAAWCGPCRMFTPTYAAAGLEELIQAVKDADIDKLRAEAAQQQP